MKTNIAWKRIPVQEGIFGISGGNSILSGDGFYISYQDFTKGGRAELFETLNVALTGDMRRDDETALHDEVTNKWHILWGDHRKAYEKTFPDKEACLAVYKKLAKKHNCDKWSTPDDN